MKRYLLYADNLLGDLLMQSPAIRALKKRDFETEVHYWVPREDTGIHVTGTEVLLAHNPDLTSVTVGTEPEGPWDARVRMDCSAAFQWGTAHGKTIAEGFGALLGVDVPDLRYTYVLTEAERAAGELLAKELGGGKPVVLVARHSASCASNDPRIRVPNKCVPNRIWVEVAHWLRAQGTVPIAIGSAKEAKDIRYQPWPGPKLYGHPIREVAGLLAAGRATLSVDTGIRHLAAAVGANLFTISCAIPLSLIRCVATRPGQQVNEVFHPIQQVGSPLLIEGARRILQSLSPDVEAAALKLAP